MQLTIAATLLLVLATRHRLVAGLQIVNPCCTIFPHMTAMFSPTTFAAGEYVFPSNPDDPFTCLEPMPEVMDDRIAVLQRGGCTFMQKVRIAEESGAKAVLVYEVDSEDLIYMSGDPESVGIHAAYIKYSTAIWLRELQSNHTRDGVNTTAIPPPVLQLNVTGNVEFTDELPDSVIFMAANALFYFFFAVWGLVAISYLLNYAQYCWEKRARLAVVKNLPRKVFRRQQTQSLPSSPCSIADAAASGEDRPMLDTAASTPGGGSGECTNFNSDHCVICMCDFEDGDVLLFLPCKHAYHSECVEPWLITKSALCPICKQSILPCGDSRPLNAVDENSPQTRFSDYFMRRRQRRPVAVAALLGFGVVAALLLVALQSMAN